MYQTPAASAAAAVAAVVVAVKPKGPRNQIPWGEGNLEYFLATTVFKKGVFTKGAHDGRTDRWEDVLLELLQMGDFEPFTSFLTVKGV